MYVHTHESFSLSFPLQFLFAYPYKYSKACKHYNVFNNMNDSDITSDPNSEQSLTHLERDIPSKDYSGMSYLIVFQLNQSSSPQKEMT